MGFKNFMKNTKRINSKNNLGTVRGYYAPKEWNGINFEDGKIVLWSNSADDVYLDFSKITNYEIVSGIEGVDENGAKLFSVELGGKTLLFRIHSENARYFEGLLINSKGKN